MATWRTIFTLLILLGYGGESALAASFGENRAYTAATNAFHDFLWERAENELEQFLERYPKSEYRAEAILLQAQAQGHQTNWSGAISLLTTNMESAGTLGDEYQFRIADAYFQQGDYAKAAGTYADFLRRFGSSPRRVEAIVGEASAQARQSNWAGVVEVLGNPESEFAQVVRAVPGQLFVARGLLLLAEAQWGQKNYAAVETALAPLEGRRVDNTLDWRAEQLRCRARLAQNRLPEALTSSSNLITLAANVPGSRAAVLAESVVLQAEVRERLGQKGEARFVLQQNLLPGVPDARQQHALLKITELALGEGNLAEANRSLVRFLAQTNNPDGATSVALFSLGEIHLRQYLELARTNATAISSEATNHLEVAQTLFGQLLNTYTNSPLLGRAELNRGWGFWLKGQMSASVTSFSQAVVRLPDSEEQVVARFKLADAYFAQKDFAHALPAYQSAVEAAARWPRARETLAADLYYQILRTSLELTNAPAAAAAMEEILKLPARNENAERSLLLLVQGLSDLGQPEAAQREYERFLALVPGFARRAEIELILGRSREQRGDWTGAVAGYDQWLEKFATNSLRTQVEFQRAWANARAGQEAVAVSQFTNFMAQYPSDERAPRAQWWVADWYFSQSAFPQAEAAYKHLWQTWPLSPLAQEACLMAGRSAMAGARSKDAIDYFTNLTSLTEPAIVSDLKVRALFAYGGALMAQPATGTNQTANYELAIQVFDAILSYPTNDLSRLAWGEKAKCWVQTGPANYGKAHAAYSQLITNAQANVTARSEAQVGRGQLFELMAQNGSVEETNRMLSQALDDYLDVVYEKNVQASETRDAFWVKRAGLAAAPLLEARAAWPQAEKLYLRLQALLPPLKDALQLKIDQAREQGAAEKSRSGN